MLSCFLFYWQRPFVKALQLICLVYLAFWFFSSQVISLPGPLVTPLISLCTVTAFSDFIARSKNGDKIIDSCRAEKPGFSIGKIVLFLTVVLLTRFAVQTFHQDLHRIPLHRQQQAEYLSREPPAYDLMIAAASDARIGNGPILQFRIPESKYFFPGTVYGDWMGVYAYKRFGHIGSSGHWEVNDSGNLASPGNKGRIHGCSDAKRPRHTV